MTSRFIMLATLLVCAPVLHAQVPAPKPPVETPQPEAPPQEPIEIEEEVIVTATRTGGRIDEQPTRVEVLTREEIEEKMLMTPGDIVMMLNEMGGMRVQTTSPSLGAASVRIQGMKGRYTRVLFDGLPLAGQQVGGLGLLQIPPMDLGQVEVIKGVASALYGAGAMGGVINLVARRPQVDPYREVLLNQSTAGATDAVAFVSGWLSKQVGATLLASGHRQSKNDIDDDGWYDLPGYTRGVVRGRLFWDDGKGTSAWGTAGLTSESREGGAVAGNEMALRVGGPESIDTTRGDAGVFAQRIIADRFVVTGRIAATFQRHDHVFVVNHERDRHTNVFGETAVRGAIGRHTWVAGAAFERESFDPLEVHRFNYFHRAPGVFVQDDIQWNDWLTVSAGARLDIHHTYGNFFSPRVAALVHLDGWTSRVSVGRGFFASTPLTEETEAAGLERLSMPAPLVAEEGTSFSADLTRAIGPATLTATLFGSRVTNPIEVERETAYEITNADRPTTTVGLEMLGTVRKAPFALTGSYTFVRSREEDSGLRVESAMTPSHSLGIVGIWEREDVGRVGVEYYFTGRQRLVANPYRTQSKAYSILGALAEKRFGPVKVFLNAENLTNTRQTKFDPLILRAPGPDGRWTVDAWAPLDGRTFNAGVRVTF
jgi:outer membrane receptor for ferrienterochelin and colicins